MCYICRMCGRCDRLENDLFGYLKPKLRCPACGLERAAVDNVCTQCGAALPPLPPPPGHSQQSEEKEENNPA